MICAMEKYCVVCDGSFVWSRIRCAVSLRQDFLAGMLEQWIKMCWLIPAAKKALVEEGKVAFAFIFIGAKGEYTMSVPMHQTCKDAWGMR